MNPSIQGLKGRLLIRQRFVTFLTAELVRLRPHTSILQVMPALERAGDLYLQLCNRISFYEEAGGMMLVGSDIADKLQDLHERQAMGEPCESPIETVEAVFELRFRKLEARHG